MKDYSNKEIFFAFFSYIKTFLMKKENLFLIYYINKNSKEHQLINTVQTTNHRKCQKNNEMLKRSTGVL